jgi:TRAP-type C4-dicarboxylate transport system substrate-binding protein
MEKTQGCEECKMLNQLDNKALIEVNDIMANYLRKTESKEGWDSLSEEDNAAIEEGLEQIEKGQTTPYDEVRKRIHKKLSQYGIQD